MVGAAPKQLTDLRGKRHMNTAATVRLCKKTLAFTSSTLLVGALLAPASAYATVRVDETELEQGENAVGGGTATLLESVLNMVDVTADKLYTDESLQIDFAGGNDIGNVEVSSSAEVNIDFCGSNEVEEVHAHDNSDVTISANGNNEFEEIEAYDSSSVTINVTGENDFEEITGNDDASITVRGTDCQKEDIVNLGEGEEDSALKTERGDLTIDHVTVNLLADETAIGSEEGDVTIDTSKIAAADDDQYVLVESGDDMLIRESVVDIDGTVHASGDMLIDHSDVKVEEPDDEYEDSSPYRVWSNSSIELVNEENGEVKDGKIDDKDVRYVDTGDDDSVDLEAKGTPAYYGCKSVPNRSESPKKAVLAATGDERGIASVVSALAALGAFVLAGGVAVREGRKRRV